MSQSVPAAFVDPFGPDDYLRAAPTLSYEVRLYPPSRSDEYLGLRSERRPPYCNCPRMVKSDGQIKVWHDPGCTEVLGEGLAGIL